MSVWVLSVVPLEYHAPEILEIHKPSGTVVSMIDHVSIEVADLARASAFYEKVLSEIGLTKLVEREATVGFGKRYPEFWLNLRTGKEPTPPTSGMHVCLRAPSTEAVDAFHAAALAAGAAEDGRPDPRPQYSPIYYAAFVRDLDGNRIEAVTFVEAS